MLSLLPNFSRQGLTDRGLDDASLFNGSIGAIDERTIVDR